MYWDTNDLYIWVMKKIPVDHFNWKKCTANFDESFTKNYNENSDKEYIFEVDVEYCKHVHDSQIYHFT